MLSRVVDRAVNRTAHPGPLPASARANAVQTERPIVDLVVGSALFRDSFVRGSGGHVDLPRLKAAGFNAVGLTVATTWPDLRGSLSRWHFRSLGLPATAIESPWAIGEWLIGRIHGWSAESDGQLLVLRSKADLDACLTPGGPIGVLIGVQGGQVLEANLGNVARLRKSGVRMFAPAHVMDNSLVGSSTGRRAGGLSDLGREVIAELEAQAIVVDLAHMSLAGISQAMPLLKRPFTLSHTGLTDVAGGRSMVRRFSPATRNIPASLAAEIGAAGGLVGIVLSTQLLGDSTMDAAVRTISLAVESAGAEHVAIGSDMDGALKMLVDVEGIPALTDTLLVSGLPTETVAGVMGGNAVTLLRSALD
ncbi:MAG TPA: membrane dipeptidase [Candidatus Limnocylindrales bacterium]|nr:membrane dipeptidase [Candidatus Limnocylindrales bacterium]